MLSRNAFNALLKTLEEPPAHVKFLFATTEVDKLPVTVLSRCQRFDLRRIPAGLLAEHFARVCEAEHVSAEADALAMIAEAAEGSVRDGLSILDQAIAHADLGGANESGMTQVSGVAVREMLGLADRSVQRRLFACLLGGDGAGLLDLVAAQYALGIEPLALMRSMMEMTHRVTVCQIGRGGADAIAPEDKAAIEEWARGLTAGQLHRLWQLLLRGAEEVKTAPEPLIAAEMALLRCLHAADMPDPGQLVKRLEELAAQGVGARVEGAAAAGPQATLDWAGLVERVDHAGGMLLATKMRMQVRVVELAAGVLRYSMAPGFADDLRGEIRAGLERATGGDWQVECVAEGGAPTLIEQNEMRAAKEEEIIQQSPLMVAAFAAFPDAKEIKDPPGVREWPAKQLRNTA